jgi:hypothetical protein
MKGLLVLLIVMLTATAACADIYTWKDNKGTRFYTNSLHEIPARYLKKARLLDVATGKIGGLATAQPAGTSAPARGASPETAPQLVQQAPPGQNPPQAIAVPPAPGVTTATTVAAPAAVPVADPAAASSAEMAKPQQRRMSRKELRALGRRNDNSSE